MTNLSNSPADLDSFDLDHARCTQAYMEWRARTDGRLKGTQVENAVRWEAFREGWAAGIKSVGSEDK